MPVIRTRRRGWLYWLVFLCLSREEAFGIDVYKRHTQYSRDVWTQRQGLPQDTIRAIAQTAEGYLWLGTDEGLARFDGYEFKIFDKDHGALPANSITALAAAVDGSLWIGTTMGLARYRAGNVQIYTKEDGLPDDAIADLYVDHAGVVWIIAGADLFCIDKGKLVRFRAGKDIPLAPIRAVIEDRYHTLWVAGVGGLVERKGGIFVTVLDAAAIEGNFITCLAADAQGNIWIGGNVGLFVRSATGRIRKFGRREGLPDATVRTLLVDRDSNVWAGGSSGLALLEGNRFTTLPGEGGDLDRVRCLFEDREGNLWMGANNGLIRLQDDVFKVYGKAEGLLNDDPTTVYQDRSGQMWVGFHEGGLEQFSTNDFKLSITRSRLPSNEVYSIRETRDGDLLVSSRRGLIQMRGERSAIYKPPDPLGRERVFEALEDRAGTLWLALPGGLGARRHGEELRIVIPGGPPRDSVFVALSEGPDGALWAGTYGQGLWRILQEKRRLFTTRDGLSSMQIRSLRFDREGTLWIGTFGGGLNAFRDGKFVDFTARDGLLSDNITDVIDDDESLWLGTTRGICRISKRQLHDFAEHRLSVLKPTNYGLEDGLRSLQETLGYPFTGGGCRSADGRLWFPTSRGLAVINPQANIEPNSPAPVRIVEVSADGAILDTSKGGRLRAGIEKIQIRYTAFHLRAPELVQYSHKLEGLDADWVQAGNQRVINYNSLGHGPYRFLVRAELPGGQITESSYDFEVEPRLYETLWFRLLFLVAIAAAISLVYRIRVYRLRNQFVLVLNERTRLAREIHDTVAQDLVGISSQLDALETCLPSELRPAHIYLDLARRMARHSLTETRRSVQDLRATALDKQDLLLALETEARTWALGSGVDVGMDLNSEVLKLPEDVEQNVFRIAQEAVTNALNHAGARKILVTLRIQPGLLKLNVADDGCGFEQEDAFASMGGHFGLIGMRERAERLGGELSLDSEPGKGTQVEVTVPLR